MANASFIVMTTDTRN